MSATAGVAMDRMYRHQRHIYDVSRSCYLLGRNRLIAELRPGANASVLEIGCGTGRNLIRIARRYHDVRCHGMDASAAMLATAGTNVRRAGISSRVVLACADATQFDPLSAYGRQTFDRVILSFVLSMVPGWKDVVAAAMEIVAPGGSLHIVDFGTLRGLPRPVRAVLRRWLRLFHTVPRDELAGFLHGCAVRRGASLAFHEMYGAYSQYAVVHMPERVTAARPATTGATSV